MYSLLKKDQKNLAQLLNRVKIDGTQYLKELDSRSTYTSSALLPKKKSALNQQGKGALETYKEFVERFEPIMVASGGPRYWGYVTGGATPAAVMGDWLAAIYDQNTGPLTSEGDISANIESETISLMLSLFGLPQTFLGGFVTGATMSNFTCLGVARQWVGQQFDKDIAKEGLKENINVLSATPHSSSIKSLAMLGIGSNNVISVKKMSGNREAIDIKDLEDKIVALDGKPFILISSAGTVNTVDFDDFTAIKALHKKYKFWWHIDAAFGGFAACSPDHANLVKDWNFADSITIDCHKWLNVPYESAIFLIKRKHNLHHVSTFQNSNAPYLGDPMAQFNYLNFLPENSRRLKALPAWFTVNAYGKDGYRFIVEYCVELAKELGKLITKSPFFDLLAPVRLNTVCFTTKNPEISEDFLRRVNQTGKVFMTPTVYNGKKGIRAALVNWRTVHKDIDDVYALMVKIISTNN